LARDQAGARAILYTVTRTSPGSAVHSTAVYPPCLEPFRRIWASCLPGHGGYTAFTLAGSRYMNTKALILSLLFGCQFSARCTGADYAVGADKLSILPPAKLGPTPTQEERRVIEAALALMWRHGCRSDYPLRSIKHQSPDQWVLLFDSGVPDGAFPAIYSRRESYLVSRLTLQGRRGGPDFRQRPRRRDESFIAQPLRAGEAGIAPVCNSCVRGPARLTQLVMPKRYERLNWRLLRTRRHRGYHPDSHGSPPAVTS